MHLLRGTRTLVIAGGLTLAACGGSDADPAPAGTAAVNDPAPTPSGSAAPAGEPDATESPATVPTGPPIVVEVERIEPGPHEDVPSGLDTFRSPVDELPAPSIDLARLRSGGPPPDGIPSIDEPIFYAAGSVDYLSSTAPVLALEIEGDARAYPLEVMVWHEIVNDTVGGVPVAVAYCPLCNSVTVFDRRVEGRVLEFGTSGLLYNSSLVMYDRQTETLWSHFIGRPLYGELGDAVLVDYPATIVGFGAWRDAHPLGLVLSRETGTERPYGETPYPGYDDVDSQPFLFEGDVDGRYTAMTRVVGVAGESGSAVAFPLLDLRAAGVLTGTLDGADIVAFWQPGSASALDTADIEAGVDVGATGVFVPGIGGRRLTFASTAGEITDVETGSTWNVFGESTDGELAGEQLVQTVHVDTFWFAWIAFHPDSAVAAG